MSVFEMSSNSIDYSILLSTFQHLKGIGPKTEKGLWEKGIFTWDDFEEDHYFKQLSLFNDFADNSHVSKFQASRQALLQQNADYFASVLPQKEYYRIVLSFYPKTIFLDIETTGLSKYYDYITIVGWSIGGVYNFYIKGDNDSLFKKHLNEAKCIVTFNGSIFDIPFLKQEFKNIIIPKTHVDLRFFSKRAGLNGGQKEIEKKIGLYRPKEIEEIDGKAATILWYKYRHGNLRALYKLIKYNYLDITGMEAIFDEVVKRTIIANGLQLLYQKNYQRGFKRYKTKFKLKIPKEAWIPKLEILDTSIKTIALKELTNNTNQTRVIGLDLTGSEKRASGLCFIEGDTAYTKLINSDSEIINYTVNQKPDLVSIDSPLSLPSGRISVHDDDPGRKKFGIMRQCERILKKRGVNVYPSLIPSMQKLTKRGIELATIFRSLGIPVIESFPGAAQDILKIPRKRSDVKMLKQGLIKFGIKGKYQKNNVSHDELDAITSAIVGLFFWYGRFEALGNLDEEYLIIPDIEPDTSSWVNRTIIGFSGPIATGKTTAGKFLESNGYYYSRFSMIIEKMLIERGEKVNRDSLQEFGMKIKKENQRSLCKELYKILPQQGNIVIDGLRHPEDHAFLVEFLGPLYKHIYIDSPLQSRRERYITMGKSEEEFNTAINHHVEDNVATLCKLAHYTISNDKRLDYFKETVENTIKDIQHS